MDRDEYALYADVEEKHWWFRVRRALLDIFIKQIPSIEKKSVLEVGSGTGGNLKLLLNGFKKRSGLEYNELGVNFSREKLAKDVQIYQGDANNLKKLNEFFDCIAFLDVLYHAGIKSVESVLRESHDILNKDGYILITDGAYNFLQGAHSKQVQSARRFTKKDLSITLKNCGFEIVKASYWGVVLFFLLCLKRLVIEKILKSEDGKSDVVSLSVIDSIFYSLVIWERPLLKFFSFPFGASVAILAKKR